MNWEPMKLVILSWVVPDPIHMLEPAMLLENTWIIYILEIQKNIRHDFELAQPPKKLAFVS
jgi:hypothetical protein